MLQEYSAWRVAQVFFDEPSEIHHLNEISRRAELAHTSVKRHLERLEEHGIIRTEEEERGGRTYPVYEARREEDEYRFYRRLDVLHRINETGLMDYLDEKFTPDCVVLFGSAARGEDVETSDVDIFLQAEEYEVDLSPFEEELNREIELHVTPDFEEYPDELKNGIANGTVLKGYLEAFP